MFQEIFQTKNSWCLVVVLLLGSGFFPTHSVVSCRKVQVSLYYETLCPYCVRFIKNQLYPTYEKISQYLDIQLIPYGNAKVKFSADDLPQFECQHGPDECYGNLVQSCHLHLFRNNVSKSLPFIECMANQTNWKDTRNNAIKCAQNDWSQITECVSKQQGQFVQMANAIRTLELNPPKKYTPWIVINGNHSQEENNEATVNLLELLCQKYLSSDVKACDQ